MQDIVTDKIRNLQAMIEKESKSLFDLRNQATKERYFDLAKNICSIEKVLIDTQEEICHIIERVAPEQNSTSRYSISKDSGSHVEIKPNNSFLHDRVD